MPENGAGWIPALPNQNVFHMGSMSTVPQAGILQGRANSIPLLSVKALHQIKHE